ILEAVFYLATGHSPWTTSDRQLLNWRAEKDVMPYVRINAEVQNNHSKLTRIDITLVKEEGGSRLQKQIRVNGVNRRVVELLGELNVVMFLPQDLMIVEGTPQDRRRYLNVTLAQTDANYAHSLRVYEKALTDRNALLRRIDKKLAGKNELTYWDDQLV